MERLFVGGLNSNISSQELSQRFKSFGQVKNCEIVTKGKIVDVENTFAYVNIIPNESDSITNLIALFNNSLWKGQRLKVERAKQSFLKILQAERHLQQLAQQVSKNENITKASNEPQLAQDLCMNVKVRNNLIKIDRLGCGNIRRYFRPVKPIPLNELLWEIPEVKRKRMETDSSLQIQKRHKQQALEKPDEMNMANEGDNLELSDMHIVNECDNLDITENHIVNKGDNLEFSEKRLVNEADNLEFSEEHLVNEGDNLEFSEKEDKDEQSVSDLTDEEDKINEDKNVVISFQPNSVHSYQKPKQKSLHKNESKNVNLNGVQKIQKRESHEQFRNSQNQLEIEQIQTQTRLRSVDSSVNETNRDKTKKLPPTKELDWSYNKFSDYETGNKFSLSISLLKKLSRNKKFVAKLQEREERLNKKQMQKQLKIVDQLSEDVVKEAKVEQQVAPEKGVVEFDDIEEEQVICVQKGNLVNFESDSEEEFQDFNEKQKGPPPQDLMNWMQKDNV